MIVDITNDHLPPPSSIYVRSNCRSWNTGTKRRITGVTLHQAGVLCTDTEERFKTLKAHIGVLRSGKIVIVNPLRWFLWHAQGLSWNTIGIEFNGLFEGIKGKPETLPGKGKICALTDEQVKAANEELFPWLLEQFTSNGGKWKFVHAHRQASAARRADPGSEIWQKIGMMWIEKLGLSDGGPNYKYGTGRPIPREWNHNYSGSY